MILEPTPQNIKLSAQALKQDDVVVFPTETVYGLGGIARSKEAIKKIFEIKKRPKTNPLIVHVRDMQDIFNIAIINSRAEALLQRLSSLIPGPLTIILPVNSKAVDPLVTAGLNTVAIRIPSHKVARALLEELDGEGIAAPSANPFSRVSPTTADMVKEHLGGDVKYILDGGMCDIGIESTVLSLVDNPPLILRPGAVTVETLRDVLGEIRVADNTEGLTIKPSPGMCKKHYSPKAKVVLASEFQEERFKGKAVGRIAFSEKSKRKGGDAFKKTIVLSKEGIDSEIARGLYRAFEEMDRAGVEIIVVDECAREGLGLAIMDRVLKASG